MIADTLLDASKTLDASTKTSWSRGDIEQWAPWARCMRDTIAATTPLLRNAAEHARALEARIAALEAALAEKDKAITSLAQCLTSPRPSRRPADAILEMIEDGAIGGK